jgi:MFS family permease
MRASPATRSDAAVRTKPAAYAWVILMVVFLAGVAGPLNQFKVPPVMPVLINAFHMDIASAAWLMSIFSVTGFILAIPAGFIMQRFGPKTMGLASVAFVVAGSVLGATSTSANSLLISRFIEGVGMGLIGVVGPAAIAMWFPAEARGLPMGVWATWVPVGNIVMFNTAPILSGLFGWQTVWWAGAAFGATALVLYALLFRLPGPDEIAAPVAANARVDARQTAGLGKAMANASLWLISLSFLCFNILVLAINTYYPTFLTTVRHLDLARAAFLTSLIALMAVFSSPLGGMISDRIGSRKKLIALPLAVMGAMFLFPFQVSVGSIAAVMIVIGIFFGPIPTATFAAVPEVMPSPQLIGIGMGVVALGQNLGMVIGPAMFGRIVDSMGWAAAGYALIPVAAIGVVAVLFARVR